MSAVISVSRYRVSTGYLETVIINNNYIFSDKWDAVISELILTYICRSIYYPRMDFNYQTINIGYKNSRHKVRDPRFVSQVADIWIYYLYFIQVFLSDLVLCLFGFTTGHKLLLMVGKLFSNVHKSGGLSSNSFPTQKTLSNSLLSPT